jgi:hypothetical protein
MCSAATYNVRIVDTLTAPAGVRRPVISLWLLRGALTAHLLAVLCQPVLAGMFLTGDVDAIGVHGAIASVVGLITLVTTVLAVGYVVGGHGRVWILPVLVALFVVEVVQIVVGYSRFLQVHVPLGVTVVVLSVLLAAWVWTPSAARARGRK